MMKSKFNSLQEWRKSDSKAYEAAKRNNMLEEISEMFGWGFKKRGENINSEIKVLLNLGLDFDEYLEFKNTTKN